MDPITLIIFAASGVVIGCLGFMAGHRAGWAQADEEAARIIHTFNDRARAATDTYLEHLAEAESRAAHPSTRNHL